MDGVVKPNRSANKGSNKSTKIPKTNKPTGIHLNKGKTLSSPGKGKQQDTQKSRAQATANIDLSKINILGPVTLGGIASGDQIAKSLNLDLRTGQHQDRTPNCSNASSEGLNASDWLEMGRGAATRVVESTLESMAVSTVSKFIPIVGPVITGVQLARQTAEIGLAVADFESQHFLLTKDYENLMKNPFLSAAKKAEITQDSLKKYQKASTGGNVVKRIKENPRGFGADAVDLLHPLYSTGSGMRKILKPSVLPPPPPARSITMANPPTERARNNFNNSSAISARNVNARSALNKKMSALEGAQKDAVKIENLTDGRIRYYDLERPARNPGSTRGSSFVTEYNPKTGQVRQWNECYDQFGNVNRIHPKTLDGQDVRAQHYPPTRSELEQFSKKTWRTK